jgi:hypothetical protein
MPLFLFSVFRLQLDGVNVFLFVDSFDLRFVKLTLAKGRFEIFIKILIKFVIKMKSTAPLYYLYDKTTIGGTFSKEKTVKYATKTDVRTFLYTLRFFN